MANRLGRQQIVGYARESPRNVPVAAATHFFPFTEFSLQTGEPETRDDESAFGMPEKLLRQDIVAIRPSGSLSGHIYGDTVLQFMLYHFFGQVQSTQDATTGAFSQQFRRMKNDSETDTFTLQYTRSDIGNLRSVGCAVQAINLEFSIEEATFSSDIIAIKEESGDPQTVAISKPSMPILSKNKRQDGTSGSFRFADDLASLSVGTDYKIRSASLSLNKEADWDPAFGGDGYAHDTFGKGASFELAFSGVVRSDVWHLGNITGTRRAVELDFNADNLPVLGTSILKPRLRVQLPPALIKVTHSSDLDDMVMFDAKMMGVFSDTDNRSIDILLQNTTDLTNLTQDSNTY